MTKKEYDKKYRQANKEKIAAKSKVYRKDNKEKLAAQKKAYNKANKEIKAASDKAYRASLNHDYCIYILPKERYIGVTKNITDRIRNHNSIELNTEGFRVLQYFDTRQEAGHRERWLHSKGYKGSVKQILEQR
tara:strand:+ start:244 stop:642 length:399 start_codon:yes stop_codon:yes gene_type:complete